MERRYFIKSVAAWIPALSFIPFVGASKKKKIGLNKFYRLESEPVEHRHVRGQLVHMAELQNGDIFVTEGCVGLYGKVEEKVSNKMKNGEPYVCATMAEMPKGVKLKLGIVVNHPSVM